MRQDFEEKNNTKQSLPSSTKAFLAMFFSEIVEETAEAIQFLQFEGKWYRITHAGERLDKMTGKIEEFEKAQRKSLEDKLKKGVRTLQERLDKKYPNNLDEKQQKAKVREYNAARDKLIREHNKAVKELYEKYPEEKTAAKRKAKIERLDTRLEHAIKDAQKRLIKEFGPRAPRVENVLKWMYRSPLGKELWTKLLAVETPVTLLIFATYAYMTPNKLQAAMNMAGFLAASRLSSATQRTLNNAMMKFAKKRNYRQ